MKKVIFIAVLAIIGVGFAATIFSKTKVAININKVPASPVVEKKESAESKDFALTGLLPPFIEQIRH